MICLQAVTLAAKPNVILILADDLGYYDLSSYGHPSIKTPVLDRIGSEGFRLTNFHSGATVCTPSRMALLTGCYPVRLGWTQGVVGYKMGMQDGMSPDALTIAEVFKSEGYRTGISGKWHLGDQPETRPANQGFQEVYGILHSNNQTKKLYRGADIVEEPFENRLLTEKFSSEAIRFIRANAKQPFFLYLPYSAPHFPVEPHPDWKGKSAFGDYGDVVEEMDFRIGEIIAVLDELKLSESTIIIFTSDNGPNPKEKADSLPFRGEKWSALEGGTRVPCVIRWPSKISPGKVSDMPVSAIDLLPTLCSAAGIDWKSKRIDQPPIDGRDLFEALTKEGSQAAPQELLYWEGMSPEPRAIRVGDWKLFFDPKYALEGPGTSRKSNEQAEKVEALKNSTSADESLLFNLRDDPGETTDLAEKFPEKVTELKERAELLKREIDTSAKLEIEKPR